MAYGLYATTAFDSFNPILSYTINIYKKDYSGDYIDLLLGANPAIHEWQDDDAFQSVRGSTLKLNVINNIDIGVSIDSFYSEDDYGFKVEMIRNETGRTIFTGYLLQDEMKELQVDFTHELQLVFTDGLGLLKDITLDQSAVIVGQLTTESNVPFQNMTWSGRQAISSYDDRVAVLKPGDAFTLEKSGIVFNFVCINILWDTLWGYIIYTDTVPTITNNNYNFTYTIPKDLNGYFSLAEVYQLCLRSTYLDLSANVYTNLFPVGGSVERFVEDVYIDIYSLKDGDSWMNCYDILDRLNSRFNLSLFQSQGSWQLIRFDELYRYVNNTSQTVPYNLYDYNFNLTTQANLTRYRTFKGGSDMEVGLVRSLIRPYQFVLDTFNFSEPDNLLCNQDLQQLGNFISQETVGTIIHKDYQLIGWSDGAFTPHPLKFMRISIDDDSTSDTYTKEIDRYIVISGASGDNVRNVISCDIPVSVGDKITYGFSFRTANSNPGPINLYFLVTLNDGINTYYLTLDSHWSTSYGSIFYPIGSSGNLNEWQNIGPLTFYPTPVSGIVNVYLAQCDPSNDQTFYRDFEFSLIHQINGKATGQSHKELQSLPIKNNSDREIFFDDTSRVSIRGSLYKSGYTNLVRNLTSFWQYPTASYSYSLGQYIAMEKLFTRNKLRQRYEGNYLRTDNITNEWDIDPLTVFIDSQNYNYFRFIPGAITNDYKNASANITLHEIVNAPNGDMSPGGSGITQYFFDWLYTKIYEFKYLYKN